MEWPKDIYSQKTAEQHVHITTHHTTYWSSEEAQSLELEQF